FALDGAQPWSIEPWREPAAAEARVAA
ncbi:MAG: hypothetical protein QOF26_2250, partial [Baekduia sp.]|nr:hypothetical protein [Baekduia sp.]